MVNAHISGGSGTGGELKTDYVVVPTATMVEQESRVCVVLSCECLCSICSLGELILHGTWSAII